MPSLVGAVVEVPDEKKALVKEEDLARCALAPEDRSWIEGALVSWDAVSRTELRLPQQPLPWILFLDDRCVWNLGTVGVSTGQRVDLLAGAAVVPAYGLQHSGTVRLPDGGEMPVGITSFAASYGADERPFLVMALPGIWRREPRHAGDPRLGLLMRAVFAHEMTHTRQSRGAGRRVGEIEKRHALGDELTDDVIQNRFGERPGHRAAYEHERDLLYAAAAAPEPARRRALAREALAAMRDRRARFFTGDEAFYAELEDLFLGLEGSANWSAYRVVCAAGLAPPEAITSIRRGGRFWSQDEGLALMLVIDELVPDWRDKLFSDQAVSVIDLLEEGTR